jgi:hypothetical protein
MAKKSSSDIRDSRIRELSLLNQLTGLIINLPSSEINQPLLDALYEEREIAEQHIKGLGELNAIWP